MALVLANRVQESATANTTVSFTLTGAVLGFQTFAVIGDTNATFYSATDSSGNWEVGLGTYSSTGPTLTRTTIYASSNTGSAVTFSGPVNVFVTYPSGKSVNLDASGNVSALGTIASGTWQGSTVGVAYGGTGVTTSSGANSVVLRDANSNITVNRVSQANTSTTAAGGTTALTAASSYIHTLVGTGNQTYTMPDATTLTTGVAFVFNNMATGTLTIQNYAAGAVGTIPAGGAGAVFLTENSTTGGIWDIHAYLPEGVTFGVNAFNLGTSIVSGGTWQGGTIQPAYGGTGLTTFVGANNALYSTGATTLTAGTLPAAAGGTGQTSYTDGQVLIGKTSTGELDKSTLTASTGISITNGAGSITITNSGVRTAQAGTGISVSGTNDITITNTAPDQVVSLSAGTGISTSGTYPSFTVTNTAPDQVVSLTAGAGISTSGTYPSFTVTNTAPDQTVSLTGAGTTSISGTYPNFTITSNDQYVGTVTSVGGTGTVNGITLTGTVTSSGNLTLGGTLSGVSLTSQVTDTLPVANGGTGQTSYVNGELLIGNTTGNTLTKATLTAGTGITVTNGTGSITVANGGVTSIAGTTNQVTASASTGSVTLSLPQSINTGASVQFGSFGVGTAASGTTGEIRATNNITAYYSDDRLKTRLGRIENALDKLCSLEGFYYEANETAQALGYEVKREVGVSAQQVQAVMPEIVAPAPIDEKYLTVRYERALPLLIEAIKELREEVRALRG